MGGWFVFAAFAAPEEFVPEISDLDGFDPLDEAASGFSLGFAFDLEEFWGEASDFLADISAISQ
jgi:hypothetical protein